MDKIDEILSRGVENIIPGKQELEKLLRSGKTLNIYNGIDPTATHVHIGNAVPLRKLQSFVDLGHNVTFLIGDFTALIGDTSDKESERPILSSEQIQENFKTYKSQAQKVLDFTKVKIVHNSEWLKDLGFQETIELIRHYSLNDFIGRELIKKRLASSGHIRLDEVIYPVMQGYDSYHLDTDVQIGGPDQTFNMQAGRALQKDLRNKVSYVLVTGYIEGTDGRKMSKSWGNAIWLDDTPEEMFGKVMSVKDDLIIQYFTLGTNVPLEEISQIKKELDSGENPMTIKKRLAETIVEELHGPEPSKAAEEEFTQAFQQKNLNALPTIIVPSSAYNSGTTISEAIVKSGTVSSKSEAKRLLEQGAIEKEGQVIKQDLPIQPGTYKVGKRKAVKVE